MKEVIVRANSFDGDESIQYWRDGRPVEFIVRCKDCKYCDDFGYWCSVHGGNMPKDGYCHCGERKGCAND